MKQAQSEYITAAFRPIVKNVVQAQHHAFKSALSYSPRLECQLQWQTLSSPYNQILRSLYLALFSHWSTWLVSDPGVARCALFTALVLSLRFWANPSTATPPACPTTMRARTIRVSLAATPTLEAACCGQQTDSWVRDRV
jgi:hypothetical protein